MLRRLQDAEAEAVLAVGKFGANDATMTKSFLGAP